MHTHRFALLAGALLALTLAVAAQQSDTTRNPLGADPSAVAAGQRLYDQGCAGCHAAAGQGVPGTAMTPHRELNDQQTWQIVSHIRSLAGTTRGTPAGAPAVGDAAAGAAVFARAQCVTCHEIDGVGGIVGPDLSAAARYGAEALRRKIVDPDRAIEAPPAQGPPRPAARPQTITARLNDGRSIRGVRRAEDTFTLHLIGLDNRLHLLDKSAIAGYGSRTCRLCRTTSLPACRRRTWRTSSRISPRVVSATRRECRCAPEASPPSGWPRRSTSRRTRSRTGAITSRRTTLPSRRSRRGAGADGSPRLMYRRESPGRPPRCATPRDGAETGLRPAKRRQLTRALTGNQRAQSLVHESCLLLHTGDTARFGQEVVIENQRSTRMRQYGLQMHTGQRRALRRGADAR